MGVIDRVAVIRNKLQPIRIMIDDATEAAATQVREEGIPAAEELGPVLVQLRDCDQAFGEILAELDALCREAGDSLFRHSEPPPESKL